MSKQVIYKRSFQASPRMLGGGYDDGEHHAHPVSTHFILDFSSELYGIYALYYTHAYNITSHSLFTF